jgi:AbiV family abortive infection protein
MKKHVIKQYSGPLTPAEAAKGIAVAIKNAVALASEALLLLQNERWTRAAALAVLAIEEGGKPSQLRAILLARDEKELREEWRNYRTHSKKNVMWILSDLVAKGASHIEDFRPIFNEDSDHGHLLDAIKQIALYSDAYGDCNWSLPENVVDDKLAQALVQIAKLFASDKKGPMTTEAELQLWTKHLGPVWKGNMADMKTALLACYAEAQALGVLQGDSSPAEMVKFVL